MQYAIRDTQNEIQGRFKRLTSYACPPKCFSFWRVSRITSPKGFTLIELLVVISIVGILIALLLVSYSGAQKQTRDTERRSDLNQYRNALENFAAANDSLYPSITTEETVGTNLCGAGSQHLDGPGFIAACPEDPLSGDSSCGVTETCDYRYVSDGTGPDDASNYVLSAPLETGGWWVTCSTGQTGKYTTGNPSDFNCPL